MKMKKKEKKNMDETSSLVPLLQRIKQKCTALDTQQSSGSSVPTHTSLHPIRAQVSIMTIHYSFMSLHKQLKPNSSVK